MSPTIFFIMRVCASHGCRDPPALRRHTRRRWLVQKLLAYASLFSEIGYVFVFCGATVFTSGRAMVFFLGGFSDYVLHVSYAACYHTSFVAHAALHTEVTDFFYYFSLVPADFCEYFDYEAFACGALQGGYLPDHFAAAQRHARVVVVARGLLD